LGSYFDDGLTASLVTENTEHKDIEDYLRSWSCMVKIR
jgi:hypothetical protein